MRLLLFLCLVGCASANVGRSGDDDVQPPDGPPVTNDAPPDGPPGPDAAPVALSLQQTTDNTVAAGNSIACGDSVDGVPTDENSWYRVFSPAEAGVTNTFTATKVTFAVEASVGTPTVQVKLGLYSGNLDDSPLDLAKITPLNSTTASVPPTQTGESIDAPITATVPPNKLVVVEIFAPTLADPNTFYLGTTTSAQTHTGYLRAPACGTPAGVAETMGSLGFPNSRPIIVLSGTH